jgi:hypothetical protein
MATPWQSTTVKDIHGIGHGYQAPSPAPVPATFKVPAPQTSLSFTAAQLQGSMAIAMVLSHAGTTRSASVGANTADFLADFIDDLPPIDLEMVKDVEVLSDVGRTFLSSLFGAAIADQYMLALGYRYRCNSREVIAAGVAGDYLYDGLSAVNSYVVMAEAKGSIVSSGRKVLIAGTVRRGYRRQVEPHVGQSYPIKVGSIDVVHGYCVGAGAAAGGGAAVGHVEETGIPVVAATPSQGAGLPGAGDPQRSSHLSVALQNFAGVTALVNSPTNSESLKQYVATGEPVQLIRREFSEITYRGEQFLAPLDERQHYGYALWAPIFDRLREITIDPLDKGDRVALFPVPPEELTMGGEDGGAVLPDGLAVLPKHFYQNRSGPEPERRFKLKFAKSFDYAMKYVKRGFDQV